MALSSEGSTFKQWFLVPNALKINILPSFDIINSINDEIKTSPELIVEEIFRITANFELNWFKARIMVDFFADWASNLTLVMANVLLSEQELSVEVADFDVVVIGYGYFAFSFGWDSHQREHLDEFAA